MRMNFLPQQSRKKGKKKENKKPALRAIQIWYPEKQKQGNEKMNAQFTPPSDLQHLFILCVPYSLSNFPYNLHKNVISNRTRSPL